MVKLLDLISPIYQQYAPLCQAIGVTIDLDLLKPHRPLSQPEPLQQLITEYLALATNTLKKQGHITITDRDGTLVIRDSSTILTPDQIADFTSDLSTAKSRLGFGTTLQITLS